jgi:hypothetical protein
MEKAVGQKSGATVPGRYNTGLCMVTERNFVIIASLPMTSWCTCENKENFPLEGWDQRLVSITFQIITPALGYLQTLSALPFNSSRLFQIVRANLS